MQAQNLRLSRDILFVAVADEEAGCAWGSKWLVENVPDLIRSEYALNEVGAFSIHLNGETIYPIGVAEKGLCWLEMRTEGVAGHGSLPHARQALPALGKVAFELGRTHLPHHVTPVAKDFILGLAQVFPFPQNWIFKKILSPNFKEWVFKHVLRDEKKADAFRALLANTGAPTVFQAGSAINVIAGEATLLVDGRLLPGQTVDDFLRELREAIGPQVQLKILKSWEATTVESSNDFYETLKKCLIKNDPGAWVVPYLSPGFTDGAFYKKLGIKCYGYVPVKLPADLNFSELFHGKNERIPVEGFLFGLKVLKEVVEETCAA
jgi:acetylornithine deacetylase/succinyl-diaminopimelate desuccinylase-like protein